MNKEIIDVPFERDEKGMIGRECPDCQMYFKLKFGTGLDTDEHICPYCGYKDEYENFFTKDQVEYIKSYVAKEVVEPMLRDFLIDIERTFEGNNFLQFEAKPGSVSFDIEDYQEKSLETTTECESCGLVFSTYGVFSNCPDCGELNVGNFFDKSIETCRKKLDLASDEEFGGNIQFELKKDVLIGAVSAFDSAGKAIKREYSDTFSESSKNLFQNLYQLEKEIEKVMGQSISDLLSEPKRRLLLKMFQVRHIYIHNAGVIDDQFIDNLPWVNAKVGTKYDLTREELEKFIEYLAELMAIIKKEFK